MDDILQAFLQGSAAPLYGEHQFLFVRMGLLPLFSGTFPAAFYWSLVYFALKQKNAFRLPLFFIAASGLLLLIPLEKQHFAFWRLSLFSALHLLAYFSGLKPNKTWIYLLSIAIAWLIFPGSLAALALSGSAFIGIFFLLRFYSQKRIFLLYGIWLFTLPMSLYYFHLLNPLAPFWSLLWGPLFTVFFITPLAVDRALQFFGGTNALFSSFARWNLEHWLMSFLRACDLRGNFFLFWTHYSLEFFVLFLLFLLALFLPKKRQRFAVIFLLTFASVYTLKFWAQPHGATILDVGQGDSILLQRPLEKPFLVDAGTRPWMNPLSYSTRRLEANGIGALAGILITHPDLDHYGGIDSVLTRHALLSNAWINPNFLFDKKAPKVLEMLERHNVRVRFLSLGQEPYPGLNCRFAPPSNKANDLSPLCRYELPGGQTLLLTGDMEKENEIYFLGDKLFLKADALKVAHHGSKTSSTLDFLLAVKPEVALISVGRKNRYHHPAAATLETFRLLKIPVERTDQSGDLFWN